VDRKQAGGDADPTVDLNAHVHELAGRLGSASEEDELWGFVCECGEPGCAERVPLSLAEYEELRLRGYRVLAVGHRRGGPVRVLVVDDSDAARRALSEVITSIEGFTLSGSAESGTEGLLLLAQSEADLVLLDVRMPELDGPETARRIFQRRPETVVVLVSADSHILREAADSAGTAWSLAKSEVSPESLTTVWADARARAAEARRDARALREEAEALRGQAGQQVRRARRSAEPR